MKKRFSIRETADLLGVKPKWLYQALREWGITTKANLPQNLMIAKDYMTIKHTPYRDDHGFERYSNKAVFTQKGVAHIDELIRRKAPATIRERDSQAANEGAANREAKPSARTPSSTDKKAC